METESTNLALLKIGQKATINSFSDSYIALRLLELGCIPGEVVEVNHVAPLGDPIAITVSGYLLSLRKAEAANVLVSLTAANN